MQHVQLFLRGSQSQLCLRGPHNNLLRRGDLYHSHKLTQGSNNHANPTAPPQQKHNTESSLQAETSQKCRKSTPEARSSRSTLMYVDHQAGRKGERIPDFEKFAKV